MAPKKASIHVSTCAALSVVECCMCVNVNTETFAHSKGVFMDNGTFSLRYPTKVQQYSFSQLRLDIHAQSICIQAGMHACMHHLCTEKANDCASLILHAC
ncbi:TPA: hypothetical protein ACH3X1_000397 [Trebouxia sp. C0004]